MDDRSSSKWRTFRACARCHRLKSKCVYESSKGCKRCLKRRLVCSPDEDPTAKEAKKRPVEVSADRIAAKFEKWLLAAEMEATMLTPTVDSIAAEQLHKHAERLQSLAQTLASVAKMPLQAPRAPEPSLLTPASVLSVSELAMSPITTPIADRVELGVDLKTNIIYQVVRRLGLLTDAEARARFAYFIDHMLGFFPLISLSKTFHDYDHLANECPMLLLVFIYVTTFDYHGFGPESENTKLSHSLRKIVDSLLAHDLYLTTTNFSYRLIYVCMVTSLWNVPSIEVGDFKTHIELLSARNIALCIDSGNSDSYDSNSIAKDDSLERNDLRCFLGLYACVASLSFSLPRFDLISWSRNHESAFHKLMQESDNLPSESDRRLCLYAQLVRIGQDLIRQLSVNGIGLRFLCCKDANDSSVPKEFFDDSKISVFESASNIIDEHRSKLVDILHQLGNVDTSTFVAARNAPKEVYCFMFTYFQILILAYDNLVSWTFCKLSAEDTFGVPNVDISENLYNHIKAFGDSCEELLNCYVDVHRFETTLPTPYHYRALQALISLIRLQVLVKSDLMLRLFHKYPPLEFDLLKLHSKVMAAMERHKIKLKLSICERLTVILSRINNWISIVAGRNLHRHFKPEGSADFFLLSQISKGQELHKLHEPHVQIDRKRPATESATEDAIHEPKKIKPSCCSNAWNDELRVNFMSSINDIFKDVDYDFYRFFETL